MQLQKKYKTQLFAGGPQPRNIFTPSLPPSRAMVANLMPTQTISVESTTTKRCHSCLALPPVHTWSILEAKNSSQYLQAEDQVVSEIFLQFQKQSFDCAYLV